MSLDVDSFSNGYRGWIWYFMALMMEILVLWGFYSECMSSQILAVCKWYFMDFITFVSDPLTFAGIPRLDVIALSS